MQDLKLWSRALMATSVIAVVLAVVGAFVADVWLASTQWLLMAGVLAVFGIYLRLES